MSLLGESLAYQPSHCSTARYPPAPCHATAPLLPLAGVTATICFLHADAGAATGEVPRLSASDAKLILQIMALNSGSANTAEVVWAGNNLIEWLGSTSKVWYSLLERGMGQCWDGKFSTLAPEFQITGQIAVTSCCLCETRAIDPLPCVPSHCGCPQKTTRRDGPFAAWANLCWCSRIGRVPGQCSRNTAI